MKSTALYIEIADRVKTLIDQGALKEGDRIPSIRSLSSKLGVSINTVKEAYWNLENQKLIEGISQSGFFVRQKDEKLRTMPFSGSQDPRTMNPQEISLCRIHGLLQEENGDHSVHSLAIALIEETLYPEDKLIKSFSEAVKNDPDKTLDYMISPGSRSLREQIALHMVNSQTFVSPDDIVVTSGCQEAVFIGIMALCKSGDTVAVESPVYFNFLHIFEQFNLKILEIPSSAKQGMHLETLEFALQNHDVKAVFSIPNYNNPLGSCMSDEHKQKLVEMVQAYDVTLVEDDIYGDISFSQTRPKTCKSFDTSGNVLLCSSFSKSLGPGLRLGWIIPGKHMDTIINLKTLLNISTNSISQIGMTAFLKEGGFDRYLRKMTSKLTRRISLVRESVLKSFPDGTSVSDPKGGCVLWVELPDRFDSLRLYRTAIKEGIVFAPGPLFSMTGKYGNCLRINAGVWNADIKHSIQRLGELACRAGVPD